LTRGQVSSLRMSELSGRKSRNAVIHRGYSVLIVGGGPAGLATAIELSRFGICALVIERSDYDDVRVGEHLQPSAVLQLNAIEYRSTLPLDAHVVSAGVEAYWGSETPNYMDYFFHPGQHGLNLSRPRFDAELARACELSGATVLRSATLARALKRKTGWEVDIANGSKTRNCSVSVIVDATGRAATFARSQGAKVRAHDRQIAVVAFENDLNNGTHTRSLVETAEIGWWYSAPIGPTRSICMLVTDDDLLPRGAHSDLYTWWLDQLSRTAQLAHRFRDTGPSHRLVVRSARSQRVQPPCGIGWLAVGDAAMAFDPMASQGIAKALDHGRRVAADIASHVAGDASFLERFALNLEREYTAYRERRADYYRIEKRWPRSSFWKRRHENHMTSRDAI
jgi:flavin-dependent dehydrogenase